jgi:preprotein translocase subunit SecG
LYYVQNPKGGGLSSDFGAAQQIGGVQKTNDFIDKATWSLAGVIMV